jgi:uroporphyrinogen-III synthase
MSDSSQNEVPGSPPAENRQGTSNVNRNAAGMVWLVGAGPGDPGFLTLKGREALDAADIVVYDRLVSEEILLTVPASARLTNAEKLCGNHPLPQEEINRILIEEARQGCRVVCLKGGDPFLLGGGGEELLTFAEAGIPCCVVPGISSARVELMIAAVKPGGQARDAGLRGLRLVVPLPEKRNGESCREINALGGTAIPFPCVKTIPRETGLWLKEIPGTETGGVWLVFTSAIGVDYFLDGAFRAGRDLRSFSRCRFAAVGPATVEALVKHNIHADFAPAVFNGRALGEGLAHCMDRGELAYLIGAGQKTPALGETLLEQGIPFRDLAIYDTIPAEGGAIARRVIEAGQFDGVLFTSPSMVAAFAVAFIALFRAENRLGVQALCIGETTGEAARKFGMKVHIADEASMQGLYRLAATMPPRKTG